MKKTVTENILWGISLLTERGRKENTNLKGSGRKMTEADPGTEITIPKDLPETVRQTNAAVFSGRIIRSLFSIFFPMT